MAFRREEVTIFPNKFSVKIVNFVKLALPRCSQKFSCTINPIEFKQKSEIEDKRELTLYYPFDFTKNRTFVKNLKN